MDKLFVFDETGTLIEDPDVLAAKIATGVIDIRSIAKRMENNDIYHVIVDKNTHKLLSIPCMWYFEVKSLQESVKDTLNYIKSNESQNSMFGILYGDIKSLIEKNGVYVVLACSTLWITKDLHRSKKKIENQLIEYHKK